MKEKIIFTLKLVQFLQEKGINYKCRKPDLKNPKRDIFIYDETPELINGMLEYANSKKD